MSYLLCLYALIIYQFIIVFSIISNENSLCDDYMGPPYIYVTIHQGEQVLKYSRNGCLLSDNSDYKILNFVPKHRYKSSVSEFRSMHIHKFRDIENALYITDAASSDSRVLVYSDCNRNSNGTREYLATVVSTQENDGVDHTYGISFDMYDNMYVSNQHTDCILRFYGDNFHPIMHFPSSTDLDPKRHYFYDGTYKQFGNPSIHDSEERGLRSILIIEHEIWIANEDMSGVIIANLHTAVAMNIVIIDNPIGLYYDKTSNLVFVSSKKKHRQGSVFAIDRSTLRIFKTYHTSMMEHPVGVVVYNSILYVAEQNLGAILSFDVQSGNFIAFIASNIQNEVEQLTLTWC